MNRYFSRYMSHYKDTIRLGVPIVLGQIGIVAVGFADNIMVGHYATDALAASSFVNSVFNLPLVFSIGFSYGLTPLVGRFAGRGETGRVGGALRDGLLANGLTGAVLSLLVWIAYLNVHRMGQPEELLPLIRPYFLLQLSSLIFVMGFNAFKQFADGIRDTVTPMWIMLGGNALNIAGNVVLIYGAFGIPAMGLTGAGVATLLSRVATFAAFVILFCCRRSYRPYRESFRAARRERHFLELNKMGLMVGAQMGMETALFGLTGVMVGWLGAVELAAHQVAATLSTLGFMIYYGVGAAISVRVSHFLGRRDMQGVRSASTAGFHLITALALATSFFFLATRGWIGMIFTNAPEVLAGVSPLIMMLAIYQFGDGLQVTYANVLRGISDVTPLALLSFAGYFLVALPVSYLIAFPLGGGLTGVWAGYPVGLTLAGLTFRARYLWKLRRIARG
ncbi:MAG: MATE family efflux transporter [Odoribacteraceae bacterium]|jgi:MATE family multidrug resistance protein|nr:MATE family efflux transporter [Odoribacteraceae bacterium]